MKYLEQDKKQEELGDDAMEIVYIGTLTNYFANTTANIPNRTLQIEQALASTSGFDKVPKHLRPPCDKTHPKRSAQGRTTHISRASNAAS